MGYLEAAGLVLLDGNAVLQFVHRSHIVRVVGIDEDAYGNGYIAGADPLPSDGVPTLGVDHVVRVVVFVDHLHRHEAAACVGQCHGDRACIEVEHRGRVKSVAVGPDHELVIDGG